MKLEKVLCVCEYNKEEKGGMCCSCLQLRAVRIFAMVRHAKDPAVVMRECVFDFVGEFLFKVGLAAFACACRIPTLDLVKKEKKKKSQFSPFNGLKVGFLP
jgi:hypothetical protein